MSDPDNSVDNISGLNESVESSTFYGRSRLCIFQLLVNYSFQCIILLIHFLTFFYLFCFTPLGGNVKYTVFIMLFIFIGALVSIVIRHCMTYNTDEVISHGGQPLLELEPTTNHEGVEPPDYDPTLDPAFMAEAPPSYEEVLQETQDSQSFDESTL